MEEPKENADKVSWTAYGRPLALKVGKVDIRKMRNQEGTIQQCSNRFDVSYFLYMLYQLSWQSDALLMRMSLVRAQDAAPAEVTY